MSSSHWLKTQIFTKLMKSDGHLSMLTFWFSWCACQMELTTSFQSKSAKFETFLHFFSIRSAADAAAVRKGEERGEKDKLCSGTVGKWQFFTWPSFLIFSSLLQPYEGSLIKVYKMTWEYFHEKSLLSFHNHHQSLLVAEIWLTRLKDKWPDWKRNFCSPWVDIFVASLLTFIS